LATTTIAARRAATITTTAMGEGQEQQGRLRTLLAVN